MAGVFVDQSNRFNKNKGLLSAIQLKDGLRRGNMTYLAVLVKINSNECQEVPDAVAKVLDEYADIMPPKLPKELPPRRATDHKIELVPGAVPPIQALYWMSPAELVELRQQLGELLDSGLMKPSKAPYGALALFQKKADGSLRFCMDYRALNKLTVKNKYLIPNSTNLFDRLSKARYFTKVDLRSATGRSG
jgi:hypothetical protein